MQDDPNVEELQQLEFILGQLRTAIHGIYRAGKRGRLLSEKSLLQLRKELRASDIQLRALGSARFGRDSKKVRKIFNRLFENVVELSEALDYLLKHSQDSGALSSKTSELLRQFTERLGRFIESLNHFSYEIAVSLGEKATDKATVTINLPYIVESARSKPGMSFVRIGTVKSAGWGSAEDRTADPEISVDLYLDTDDETAAQKVVDAAQALAEVLGYEGVIDERIDRGSFWRRAKALLKRGTSSREVRDRLTKIERVLELQYIEPNQAEVDSKESQAVSTLIESLADVPDACVRVGSILLIKFSTPDGSVIQSRTLSQIEIRAFEKYPEIQLTPRRTLEALATAVETMQEEANESRIVAHPLRQRRSSTMCWSRRPGPGAGSNRRPSDFQLL